MLLLVKKKYMTVLVGLVMGVVYMVVDYGIFNLLLHTRSISQGYSLFWVLLWISKDKHLLEWSMLILGWWFCCPLITQTFAGNKPPIVIQRTTGAYHGYMALLLFVGYLGVIVYNLFQKEKEKQMNIPWLLAIGILVQFGWEAGLLLGGSRSAGFSSGGEKILTLVVNSLLETNLGMPYIYCIFAAYSSRFTEQLTRREHAISFTERIAENHEEHVKM